MESDFQKKDDCFEIEIPFSVFQYLSTHNCNIHSLCRICLSEKNQELYPLISSADSGLLQEMFTAVSTIQVYPNDGLPSHICDLCRANVMNCYEFKTQCMKSDCTLKSLLKGEFVTKDELSSATNEISEPTNATEVPVEIEDQTKDIKKEEIQYSEDLSGSDNEPLCIIQNTEKTKEVKEEETDSLLVLKSNESTITNKIKEKKEKSHVCNFCFKRFRNTKAMKSHIKRHHEPARHAFSCPQCAESFETDHDLNLHLPVHGDGPSWTCVQCNKSFKGRSMFRRHIQRHMQSKRYSCESCGKPFTELYALRRHSRVHTGEKVEKRHACHLCDKRYAHSSLLEAHIARHSDARPCVCAECGKAFPSARLLHSHRRVHADDKPHQCRHCDKRFRHESTRRTHERTHTGERPYVCAACGKRFIQNSNLTLHMRTHTGDRPYSCDTCGRSFSSGSTLKTHLRTHTGEKPYECKQCGKKFARMALRAHVRSHSGERPFACSACARRFATAARLRDHCRVHTGEKPFECGQCSQKFGSKSHLVKHVKTHQTKKKYTPIKQPDQPKIIANDNNEIDNVKETSQLEIIERASEDAMDDSKEIIVEDDDAEITGEIIIPNEMSEPGDIQTDDTLCVASEVNTDMNYPSNLKLVTVDLESTAVKVYQVDQSLVQIHSSGGQVTISKITSKMTANF